MKRSKNTMKRSGRVFLNDLNQVKGEEFDFAAVFVGSGAPRLTAPFRSTSPINKLIASGWAISKTARLGMRRGRLWIELIFEKERAAPKTEGRVVGMDSNYRNGQVFSDGQQVGQELHAKIQNFGKREKHTRQQIKEELAREVKKIDLREVKTVVIEDLKRVKDGKRGTFSRTMNRRLSHWQYAYAKVLATIIQALLSLANLTVSAVDSN